MYHDFIHRSFQEYDSSEFILSRNYEFQKEIFLDGNNIVYNDRFELLNCFRMVDESKYKHTCIAPVVKKFIELFKTCVDIKEFAIKQVDVIDL